MWFFAPGGTGVSPVYSGIKTSPQGTTGKMPVPPKLYQCRDLFDTQ